MQAIGRLHTADPFTSDKEGRASSLTRVVVANGRPAARPLCC